MKTTLTINDAVTAHYTVTANRPRSISLDVHVDVGGHSCACALSERVPEGTLPHAAPEWKDPTQEGFPPLTRCLLRPETLAFIWEVGVATVKSYNDLPPLD